jgi:hypothetical protein
MSQQIKELDIVTTLTDLTDSEIKAGAQVVVLEIFRHPVKTYLVEQVNEDGSGLLGYASAEKIAPKGIR